MNNTILVTGGAGYIGGFTVKALLDAGHRVVVLDSLENGHKEAVDPRATLEVADLGDRRATERVFLHYPIDAVIDFAAYLAVGESMEEPQKYLNNNVENFIQLLDVMVENGCQYIIKSSTASTYGNPEDKFFPLKEGYQAEIVLEQSALLPGKWNGANVSGEDFFEKIIGYYQEKFIDRPELLFTDEEIAMLRIPASVYGLTKLMDELLMKKYDKLHGIKSVALRYFNVCGAAEDGSMGEDKPKPTTLMTLCFWNVLGKMPELSIFGNDYPTKDGTGIRDYIHPLDLATGHIAALEYVMKTDKSNTINLGCGKGYSVFEVISAVEAASGKKISYSIQPRRSGDPAISYADPGRAKNTLGWEAEYSLEEMATTAWKWHSARPNGYRSD